MICHAISDISDTIITLKNPNRPFAVWEDQPEPHNAKGKKGGKRKGKDGKKEQPIIFRVNSKTLIQSSKVFSIALTGGWKESVPTPNSDQDSENKPLYNLTAEDYSFEAVRTVLNAIHNRTGPTHVPRKVTLEMLCQIAVMVDYYVLHDALAFFTSTWLEDLQGAGPGGNTGTNTQPWLLRMLPKEYGRELLMWICVSSVFRLDVVFKEATRLAMWYSNEEEMWSLGLPIPCTQLDEMNTMRRRQIDTICDVAIDINTCLRNNTLGCSRKCRAMILGLMSIRFQDHVLKQTGQKTAQEVQVWAPSYRDWYYTVESAAGMLREIKQNVENTVPLCLCYSKIRQSINTALDKVAIELSGLSLRPPEKGQTL